MAVRSDQVAVAEKKAVLGYMPQDVPPIGAMLSLGFQQVLTMFPATVLVAILTKFDVGVTLLTSGLGTIIALLVSRRRIPLYYGSSFSYIAVIISVMSVYDKACFAAPNTTYCPSGVQIAQLGILGTAAVEIIFGLLIMRIGKASLDKFLPPIITGSIAIVIGISLAGAALNNAANQWFVAFVTLFLTIIFSVYLQGKGLLGMLPILLGAIAGYIIAIPFGLVSWASVAQAAWFRIPNFTLPAFSDPRAWGAFFSVALIAIATIPE
jgi:uracil permease